MLDISQRNDVSQGIGNDKNTGDVFEAVPSKELLLKTPQPEHLGKKAAFKVGKKNVRTEKSFSEKKLSHGARKSDFSNFRTQLTKGRFSFFQ